MKGDTPSAIQLQDYRPPAYEIERVDLQFDLGEDITRVQSSLLLNQREPVPLVLQGHDMQLISVSLDGEILPQEAYAQDEDSLAISIPLPQRFQLTLVTEIKPQENTTLEGLYQSSGNFCTQCEAEGFRKITYFLDRPDVMAVYTTTIIADRERYPVLLSNGNPVEQGELEGNRHWVKWHDPHRKPCYLFALVAGDLRWIEDEYRTQSGRKVTLRIYVEPDNIRFCDHAMQSLKKAMRWDEERFGLEYDLDIYMIVAVNDFNMGAMENKGLNVFNSKYVLASPATATDSDYEGIENVIAHEYFHNWTGNRVTCRDWFQLSLKEGLTVYRDQEFSCDVSARTVKRIQDVRILRTHQFAEDASPMAHPVRPQSYVEINNFYTVTVYNKGAEVVRMYQSLFGVEGFRRGMDLYFERHDGQAVTTDDFRQAMADANQADLSQFQRWYDQAGTPEIMVTSEYDARAQRYTLCMRQSCPATPGQEIKQPFMIPVVTALLDRKGERVPLQTTSPVGRDQNGDAILVLSDRQQAFTFESVLAEPVPSLLRGFSAPVKLHYDYSDADLIFLMQHDDDGFNRWESSQVLFLRILGQLAECHAQDRPLQVDDRLIDALRQLLGDADLEMGLLAEMLSLPSESYLAEEQAVSIKVDSIHFAREWLIREIAGELREELLLRYDELLESEPYQFDAISVARRRLRNTCLSYLMRLDDSGIVQRCIRQFQAQHNMTDVMAALSCLVDVEGPEREQALQDFYQRWKHDPLVLDKWFAIQASSSLPDTLDRVRGLLRHESFNLRNPNKVRALVGAFAMNNPVRFHGADGAGYALVAEQILKLDELNPQVAARMLKAFSRWRRYDTVRQDHMRLQLQRILARPGLSRDCFEVASKSLA